MKIAVPTKDGCVDDHFGHCILYEIIDGKVAAYLAGNVKNNG